MFYPRIIPVLLLQQSGLVKSVGFRKHKYIGDPINAVRIFNDLRADELVFLDIEATKEKRLIQLNLVRDIGEEANMPFAVGGGIRNIQDIRSLLAAGAEKVVIGSFAIENPKFIKEASGMFGSSSIVVCMDVKKNWLGKQLVWGINGKKPGNFSPFDFAQLMEQNGAGEIIVQSIEKDGCMTGYDLSLIKQISEGVGIPVVALGGAGKLEDIKNACIDSFASACAAGSMFVYQGSSKGVLINYPEQHEKHHLFNKT